MKKTKTPQIAYTMNRPGSGAGEPAAGAHEQAGADRAADGDHLDLPGFQALVVALFLVRQR